MKFKSRKDYFFQSFVFGICGLILGLILFRIVSNGYTHFAYIFIDIIMFLAIGFLLWIHFGTSYELNQNQLKYKSGPIQGKIEVSQIKEIIVGKTMWSGLKPATAKNGLIIKYNRFDEIYISPNTNDTFVEEILKVNSCIKITTH